ncbi:MAG: uroporphyrinogen-III synthase [Ignavibacterium sp.]|nr:uroporphyrinogen-III synthase [Ignavibacterium sp.]
MFPLQNKKVVITRAQNQIKETSWLFKNLGADVIEFPTIKITEPDDWSELDNLITNLKFDLIIFTSTNSVLFFHNRVKQINVELNFDKITVLAVGFKTAELCKTLFSKVDLIPEDNSSNGIIELLRDYDLRNKNILIPRSEISDNKIYDYLKSKMANVYPVIVYKNSLPDKGDLSEVIDKIKKDKIDIFIFTSPSTFKNFIELLELKNPSEFFNSSIIGVIGKTTKSEIEKFGIRNILIPEVYTLENLAKIISNYFKKE